MPLKDKLLSIIDSFGAQSVAGIGDLMLDQYKRAKLIFISPEAPVLDVLNPEMKSESPGGAANVVWNIAHMGGRLDMVGAIGADLEGTVLKNLLESQPGTIMHLIKDESRPTTLKLRYYHNSFQVLRVSQESRADLPAGLEADVRRMIREAGRNAKVFFVQDYGKGMVRKNTLAALKELRRERPDMRVVLDPRVGNESAYEKGMCDILKPNWKEACHLTGNDQLTTDKEKVARELSLKYDCDVMMTLGGEGAAIYERGTGLFQLVPTVYREAIDIAGAGDNVLAAFVLALSAGASMKEAAMIANSAANVGVRKTGTCYATRAEMKAEIDSPEWQDMFLREEMTDSPALEAVPAGRSGSDLLGEI